MTVELVAPSISVTLLEPSLAMKILSVTGVGAVISPALECIYHREGLRLREAGWSAEHAGRGDK